MVVLLECLYGAHLFIFADVIPQIMSPYFWCYILSLYTCLFSNLLVCVNNSGMFSVLHSLLFLLLTKQKYIYIYRYIPYAYTLMWEYRESLQKFYVYRTLWLTSNFAIVWFDEWEIDISITHVTLLPVHMVF